MVQLPNTPVAAGLLDWIHERNIARHQYKARLHKLKAREHNDKADEYENGLTYKINPAAWLAVKHHRAWAKMHQRHVDFHEGAVNEQKRDEHGRWTASFSSGHTKMIEHPLALGKCNSRKARYMAKQGASMGWLGGITGGVIGTLIFPIVGTAIGAYAGHRIQKAAQERNLQLKRAADGLEIQIKNQADLVALQKAAQEAGVKPKFEPAKGAAKGAASFEHGVQVGMALSYCSQKGIACGPVLTGMTRGVRNAAKAVEAWHASKPAVISFATGALAAGFYSWITLRGAQASVVGSAVTVQTFGKLMWSDLVWAIKNFKATVRGGVQALKSLFSKKPADENAEQPAAPAASMSGPPKYHQLYEGLSNEPKKTSRKARYMAKCGLGATPESEDQPGASPYGETPNDHPIWPPKDVVPMSAAKRKGRGRRKPAKSVENLSISPVN